MKWVLIVIETHNRALKRNVFEKLLFQEEECEENYVKKCFIQYGKTAQNVTVNICRTPLVKDCDIEGDEVTRFSPLKT